MDTGEDDKNLHKLPLDPRKQAAVLGWLIRKPDFFNLAHTKIKPNWFALPTHSKIYSLQQKWYSKYAAPPTAAELQKHPEILSYDIPEMNSIKAAIENALMETENFTLEPLKQELTEWMQARIFREGVDKSVKLFNKGDFAQCYTIAQTKMAEVQEAKFDDNPELKFGDFNKYLQEFETMYDDAMTTGLKILDDALVPSGDSQGKGALLRQSTTLLMAPVNVGKTSCMLSIITANALRRRKILYMTHEGVPKEIRIQMLLNILGVSRAELFELYKKPEGFKKVSDATKILDDSVTYMPFNRAGMTVEELVPIIRQKNKDLQLINGDRGYDMMVSDYPALLSTELARGGRLERRNIDDYIYKQFTTLALELDLHCVCAIQTNRQGSIANRNAERLLSMEDVMESWGPMASATNVITLNRDVRSAKANRILYHIVKSRSSRTGRVVVARSKYEAAITHNNKLGGSVFWGGDSIPDRLDDLMDRYKNQEIPDHELSKSKKDSDD